jgi:hypothetical protein
LQPASNNATCDLTPGIVARICDENRSSKQTRLFLDRRTIEDHNSKPRPDTLAYAGQRLELGRHRVQIAATDGGGLETNNETNRLRVLRRQRATR